MTSNTRRPGFRLWGGDSEDEPEEQQTGQQPDAAESAEESAAKPAAEAPAVEQPAAEAAATQPTEESSGFLASLVTAMRSVAEEARDSSLAEFRESVDRRIDELESEVADRSEDLRQQADSDLGSIGEWERSEIDRVKAEAAQKTEARRAELDKQLADHRSASEQQVEGIRAKLAEHEGELKAFFAQLSEIHDPGAFVAAAKRMPRPPQISGAAAPAAAHETLDMRLAALGVDRSESAETAEPQAITEEPQAAAQASTEAVEAAPPAETTQEAAPAGEQSAGAAAEPQAMADEPQAAAQASTEAAAETAPESPDAERDAQLAGRLAELDDQLATPATPATPEPSATPQEGAVEAPAAGGETSTAIVVKGLGSFGAITSFKQALERVDGILGVTLSLGPTGEFVYRASHAADFDLVAAVRSVEGAGAQIERGDGALRVSVNRNR